MDKILKRYNQVIITIGSLSFANQKFDFKNEIDYLKYVRLKRSKDLYNRLLDDDIFAVQTDDEIKEILNKISFE